ncbi:hypothetical protein BDV38DRAFT_161850 [Aspergillus pseudotamarii]|uniref:Uncharacterized protein n=1 Tax=Aspergillus pseudotamarii TaxID=132259 RepID=A0A5N6SLG2_ASPPS|nr:uncharacterized protein BDV38DRAFT_161850 [Aspergillus pseudotamarii]KAE8134541.1 hypothetical protein BDV38DRAFT_161850 [Aspergillus pseudotamarii]
MATSDLSNPDSLAVLTAMVNQTLIETGRFFRSGGSTQSRAQLKRSLPVAHEQFQSALDNLSEQIFIAKTFLERDYEAIAAQKAALQPAEDVVMSQSETIQDPEAAPQVEATAVDTNQVQSEPSKADAVQSHTSVDAGQQNSSETLVKEEKPAESAAVGPNQSQPGPSEINFDSVLDDTGGANDFDLNLDFGDDDLGNENFLSGSNLGTTNTASATEQEKGVDQSGNTTTEVPGLETGAANIPTGGDMFDLELQKTEAFSAQNEAPEGQQGNTTEDIMAPGESSFDDLFMDNENFGSGDVGDPSMLEGDSLMNMNELDDSWFT